MKGDIMASFEGK